MPIHFLSYRFLIIIFSPIIFGHILWLSISNKQSRYFWQRLGFNYSHLPKNCTWFHCASVGEVNTLLPLLKNLHKKNDQLKIIITTNTITGSKVIRQQNLDYLFHSYLPFDWPYAVKRFLLKVNPVSLYVMETEIWPNLFDICCNKKIPVYILNARLSKKTTTANRWVRSLLSYSLRKVNKIYARSEEHALAYKKLGAPENIIVTTGNLKFTTAIHSTQSIVDNSISINRKYVLLASTHDDEERQIYKRWKQLDRDELLIIAPRHPERGTSIIKQLDEASIAVRSKKQAVTDITKVFLLDTIGELKQLFPGASLVIMGGSFVPVGGHNILEPASYNRAIVTGPYMENFKEELELMLDKKAIIQVASYDELENELNKLLNDDDYQNALETNTEKLTHNVVGILKDYTDLILRNKSIGPQMNADER